MIGRLPGDLLLTCCLKLTMFKQPQEGELHIFFDIIKMFSFSLVDYISKCLKLLIDYKKTL